MKVNSAAAKNVMSMIKKHDVKMIDFRFTDLPGQWQHFSVPGSRLFARCSWPHCWAVCWTGRHLWRIRYRKL